MDQLTISTNRLLIRHLSIEDLEHFHSYRSNPEVSRYEGFDVMSIEDARQFINDNAAKQFGKAGEWVQYAIESKEAHTLVGDCAIKLHQYDPRIAEIGITISHQQQKKGFARETLLGILGFLFNIKRLHRVVEIVDVDNIASINLLKSTGFRQEGHFIENIFFKGKWGSELQFAMLKREWEQRTGFAPGVDLRPV